MVNVRTVKNALKLNENVMQNYFSIGYHSAGKHDRGPLFFTLFSFRLIRSRSKYYNLMENTTEKRSDPVRKIINIAQKRASTVIRNCVK